MYLIVLFSKERTNRLKRIQSTAAIDAYEWKATGFRSIDVTALADRLGKSLSHAPDKEQLLIRVCIRTWYNDYNTSV